MNGRVVLDGAAEEMRLSLAPETLSRDSATRSDFDAIFVEYYPRVVSIIARLVADRTRAEHLAADVFWKLHRTTFRRPGKSNVGGWLYRVALRVGLDALRTASRRTRHETAAAIEQGRIGSSPDPLADMLAAEQRAQVRATLARLKPRQARLLLLRSSGFTYQEIAGTLKLNPRSVGTLLARAEEAFERRYGALHGRKS